MATTVTVAINAGTLPAGYCYPANPQRFFKDILDQLTGSVPAGETFVFGTTAPSDTTQPWLKTNPDGGIIGWFTFVPNIGPGGQGAWVSPYPISADSRQHWLWNGNDQSDLWSFDGGDGTDPSVAANVSPATGSFWQVDHAFDGRMPFGPNPAPATPPINVGDIGGAISYKLDGSHIPAHQHQIPVLFNDKWYLTIQNAPNGLFYDKSGGTTLLGNVTNPVTNNFNWPFCVGTSQATFTDCYFFDTKPWGSGTLGGEISTVSPYKSIYIVQRTARKYITG